MKTKINYPIYGNPATPKKRTGNGTKTFENIAGWSKCISKMSLEEQSLTTFQSWRSTCSLVGTASNNATLLLTYLGMDKVERESDEFMETVGTTINPNDYSLNSLVAKFDSEF
jgi:hypothetical protein